MSLVEFDQVTKRFQATTAVRGISLRVSSGSTYGILGPNGAGKTTTLRMLMDIIHPDKGTINLFGTKMNLNPKIKERIGYLPEERGLYQKMRVLDTLVFLMRLKGVTSRTARNKASLWLERFGMLDLKQRRVEELSRGMKQKVQFITAVAHDPALVVLDEPFVGLDPINMQLIKDTMLELKKQGKAVVVATHLLEEAERLCDRVILIDRGVVALQGDLRQIRASYGRNKVLIDSDGQKEFLRNTRLVTRAEVYDDHLELYLPKGADPQDLLKMALRKGRVNKFEIVQLSLRDIFMQTMEGKNV